MPIRMLQSGNVLFIILLAVALFAALSYAVTSGERGGAIDISEERAETFAAQVTQHGTHLEHVVQRLRLSNGCKLSQISFNYDSDNDGSYIDADDSYNNTTSPADHSCHVFHVDGGAQAWVTPELKALDLNQEGEAYYGQWFFSRSSRIQNIKTTPGTSDLMVLLPYVSQLVCIEINTRLGITNPSGDAVEDNGTAMVYSAAREYDGTIVSNNVIGSSGTDYFSGQHSGCFKSDTAPTPSGTYHYYHILEAGD